MFFLCSSIFAQDPYQCTIIEPDDPITYFNSQGPCYDMDYIQQNCITVFVNVNVHFFLDDDCAGLISVGNVPAGDYSRHNAFNLAEQLIDQSNAFYSTMNTNQTIQWNQAEHGADVTGHQCTPYQYVLKGVYFHCDTDKQTATGSNARTYRNEIVNGSSEINVFLTNVEHGGSSGFTIGLGNNHFVSEDFRPAGFNHEMIHCFSQHHTFNFSDDDCDDTFKNDWTWDGDGDGTIDQTGRDCWSTTNTYNDMDACDENLFVNTHYCCEDSNQNNNLMTYSRWAGSSESSALTPCQIGRTLDHVNDEKCDFIADVGSCPPPSAFIGRLPEAEGYSNCESCFYLNASHNESAYQLEIKDSDGNIIIETGYIDNKAGKYCLRARYDGRHEYQIWPYDMVAGEEYTMSLYVQNECGDFDTDEVDFILHELDNCMTQNPTEPENELEVMYISPNPATDIVTLNFNLKDMGLMKIYGKYVTAMNIYNNPKIEQKYQGDAQQMTFDVSNWEEGINTVIFQFKDEIYIENIIKQ